MTRTAHTIPDVPSRPGPQTSMTGRTTLRWYRIVFGELRNTDGVKFTTVQATAVQFADGRIDDGTVHEAPRIYLGDDGLTSAQARELAELLIGAADQADRWAEQHRGQSR